MAQIKNDILLAIVIPTYNEADNITTLLSRIKESLDDKLVHFCKVLVVDDNSPDGTANLVTKFGKKHNSKTLEVSILRRPSKNGLGRAYIAGFSAVLNERRAYTHILQMDADMSHDPMYIPKLIEKTTTHDLVVGSRYIPGGATPDWSWDRKCISRLGNLYARTMLGNRIHDYTGGFNLYSHQVLRHLDPESITAEGYGFLIELKYKAIKLSESVAEVPIVFMDRSQGTSKLPKNTLTKNLLLVLRLRWL